jgi:anthranilate phosphoribosyltransferase
LTRDEATLAMDAFIAGDFSHAQLGCMMMGLRMRGETSEELQGFLAPYVSRSRRIELPAELLPIVDMCGTGGDGPSASVFNVSTTAMFVAVGAGVRVLKHGTSAVSSDSGSTDVLKQLGVQMVSDPEQVVACLKAAGVAYIHGPSMNPAMGNVIGPRRETGMRSFFNLLGPMSNPAAPERQVIGVYDPRYTEVVARTLASFGRKHVLVVCAEDGLDEISITTRTHVSELKNGSVRSYTLEPEELGVKRATLAELSGGDPATNATILRRLLSGELRDARRELVAVNAGAALVVAGKCDTLREGAALARASIDQGDALAALERLSSFKAGAQGANA